eukprot:TRINITY_DN1792_c0_g1_i9.p1 TRINITY_DN1792_c0_g1~~TRINITY_DN1792_c0_g1_i9.p1  ORF type:complete len:156 (-),score=13.05 TRINITY_DN1792_c0_g1_i9:319-786(-)
MILPPWLFRPLWRRLPLVSLVAFMDAVRMCCLAIRYDLYPRSSFTALETSCLLTPRFLANLDKEVPGDALMDFSRPARKRGGEDLVSSHVVGLAVDLPLSLPGIEDPVHGGLGVVEQLVDSSGLVSRASQFEDGVPPCLFHDGYCLLSKELWWKF